jgi:mannose-6-phosphate isomerase-like protein (cupin superfamily)
MARRYTVRMRLLLLVCVLVASTVVSAADPKVPVIWTAKQLADTAATAKGKVDPTLHRGVERLLDSATLIYRDGPSEAEAHTDRADFITVREGRGTILIGGTIVGGRTTAPAEIRGTSIEGGQKYAIAAGDSLYIPVNMPHQFLVAPGEHFVVVIVKVVPRE